MKGHAKVTKCRREQLYVLLIVSTVGSWLLICWLASSSGIYASNKLQLSQWLARYPENDGIVELVPPVHFGNDVEGEEKYIKQMKVDRDAEKEILSSLKLLWGEYANKVNFSGPALELGAGQGMFSRPLIASGLFPDYVVTDSSAGFLKFIRSEMDQVPDNVHFVVMDSLQDAPDSFFSMVALRYVLHHVPDWKQLIHDAARVLRPGGVLYMEEPVADGFLLMRSIIRLCRKNMMKQENNAGFSDDVLADLQIFVDVLGRYLNTDIDKSSMEDKHQFAQYDMFQVTADAGLRLRMFPSQGMQQVLKPSEIVEFDEHFRHNFGTNFQFGPETRKALDYCYDADDGNDMKQFTTNMPVVMATFFAVKE